MDEIILLLGLPKVLIVLFTLGVPADNALEAKKFFNEAELGMNKTN